MHRRKPYKPGGLCQPLTTVLTNTLHKKSGDNTTKYPTSPNQYHSQLIQCAQLFFFCQGTPSKHYIRKLVSRMDLIIQSDRPYYCRNKQYLHCWWARRCWLNEVGAKCQQYSLMKQSRPLCREVFIYLISVMPCVGADGALPGSE